MYVTYKLGLLSRFRGGTQISNGPEKWAGGKWRRQPTASAEVEVEVAAVAQLHTHRLGIFTVLEQTHSLTWEPL